MNVNEEQVSIFILFSLGEYAGSLHASSLIVSEFVPRPKYNVCTLLARHGRRESRIVLEENPCIATQRRKRRQHQADEESDSAPIDASANQLTLDRGL